MSMLYNLGILVKLVLSLVLYMVDIAKIGIFKSDYLMLRYIDAHYDWFSCWLIYIASSYLFGFHCFFWFGYYDDCAQKIGVFLGLWIKRPQLTKKLQYELKWRNRLGQLYID